jgi:hypothetical protein
MPTEEEKGGPTSGAQAESSAERAQAAAAMCADADTVDSSAELPQAEGAVRSAKTADEAVPAHPVEDDSLASISENTATLQRMFDQERERRRMEQTVPAPDRPAATPPLSDSDSTSIVIPPFNPMGFPATNVGAASKADMGLGLGAISWDEARRPFALQQPAPMLGGAASLTGPAAQPFPGMGSSLGLGFGGLGVGSSGGIASAGPSTSGRSLSDNELSWGLGRSIGGGQRSSSEEINLPSGDCLAFSVAWVRPC